MRSFTFLLWLWMLEHATAQETAPDNFTTSEPDYTELDGNDTSTSEDAIQTPTSDNATIAVSTYNSIVTEGGSTSSMDFGTVRDNNSPSTVGAIVGGVIGGVVALTLLVVIIAALVIRKKRKTRKPVQAHCSSDYYLYNSAYGQDVAYDIIDLHLIGAGPPCHVRKPQIYSYVGDENLIYSEQTTQDHDRGHECRLIRGMERSTEAPDAEAIYQVPAMDEDTLYVQLKKTFTITRDTVLLGDYLGSGQFGTVYKGVWQSATGGEVEVAVKTLKERSKRKDKIKFLQEAAIMRQFKHPNVVELFGAVTTGQPVLLVIEMLKCGNLLDCLLRLRPDKNGSIKVDEFTLLSYCRQVASGMAYLSSKAFVHRDLAARNILISDDGSCKIADFGMSRDLMDEKYYISHGGKIPIRWTAPEALHYRKYSTASDIWSYGILMYEIWSLGEQPYTNLTNNEVLNLVDIGYRLPPPPGCPRALYAIMISCWHPVKSKRPGFHDVCHKLSLPDTNLMKWTEEDKSIHPEVNKLGGHLLHAQDLYKDLQTMYKQSAVYQLRTI